MIDLKLDLHIHSFYSNDSYITPSKLFPQLKKRGLDGFSITDHDLFKKTKFFQKKAKNHKIIYIPGIEVQTNFGDILLLFLKEKINLNDKNFYRISEEAREQNSLVILAHPFDFLRRTSFDTSKLSKDDIKKYVDGIEVMNSRIILKWSINKAIKFGKEYNLIKTGGSDSHTPSEIGHGYTYVRSCEDTSTESIYEAMLSKSSFAAGRLSNPFVHLSTKVYKLRKRINR
ncbi:MAG: CehA/McbA family metallohydrolase [Candidatus Lokiarchaeota archaeon]